MYVPVIVALAENDIPRALPVGLTSGIAAVVTVAALLSRRRLPAGVAEGALVTAVSGGALLLLSVDSSGSVNRPAFGHVLTGLAVLWYAIWQVAQPARSSADRHLIFGYAGLVCGLGALVESLTSPAIVGDVGWLERVADVAALLVLAAFTWMLNAGPWTAYPLITVVVCSIAAGFAVADLRADAATFAGGMTIAGALAVFGVLGAVLRRWWHRRRQWLQEPQVVAEPVPLNDVLLRVLVGISVLIGLGGVLLRDSPLTPTAVLLAALTCLMIAHVRSWHVAGEIGLLLLGGGIATGVLAWLRPGCFGALLAIGVAGIYLLWLARFWDQQLNDGRPWTTAGRLIPIARRLAYSAAAGVFAAGLLSLRVGDLAAGPIWPAAIAVVLPLGYMSLLVRDGAGRRRPGAAFGACVVISATAAPAQHALLELTGFRISLVAVLAAGALLLMIRVRVVSLWRPASAIYRAYAAGVVPLVALFCLLLGGPDVQAAIALVLAAGAAALVFGQLQAGRRPLQTTGQSPPDAR